MKIAKILKTLTLITFSFNSCAYTDITVKGLVNASSTTASSIPLSSLGVSVNPNTTVSGEITANVFIDNAGKYKAYVKTSNDSSSAYFTVDLNNDLIEKYFHITWSDGKTGNPTFFKKIESSVITIDHPLQITLRTTRNLQKSIYDKCNSFFNIKQITDIKSKEYKDYESCVLSVEKVTIKPEPPSCMFKKRENIKCIDDAQSTDFFYSFDFALTQSKSNILENLGLYKSCEEANIRLMNLLVSNRKESNLNIEKIKSSQKYYNATSRMISCMTKNTLELTESERQQKAKELLNHAKMALNFMTPPNKSSSHPCPTCRAQVTNSAIIALYILTDSYSSKDRKYLATKLSEPNNIVFWDTFYNSYTKNKKKSPKSPEIILEKLNKIEDCEIRKNSC